MDQHTDKLPARSCTRAGCVLVVDDDPSLARLLQADLHDLGYDVRTFTSPLQALRAVKSEPGRYCAVVTDETMPEMNGTSLVGAIRRISPAVVAVLVTGHWGLGLTLRARAAGIGHVLRKPVDTAELVAALERGLASRA